MAHLTCFRVVIAALHIAFWGVGCRSPDAADLAIDARRASAAWTAEALGQREAERTGRLIASGEYVEANISHDVRRMVLSFQSAGRLLNTQLMRWQAQEPEYLQAVAGILRGRPEDIEPTAILFW